MVGQLLTAVQHVRGLAGSPMAEPAGGHRKSTQTS